MLAQLGRDARRDRPLAARQPVLVPHRRVGVAIRVAALPEPRAPLEDPFACSPFHRLAWYPLHAVATVARARRTAATISTRSVRSSRGGLLSWVPLAVARDRNVAVDGAEGLVYDRQRPFHGDGTEAADA